MSHDYTANLSEPWFSLVADGKKIIEGRPYRGKWAQMKPGDIIRIESESKQKASFDVSIVITKRYPSFREMLTREALSQVLPGVETVDKGVDVYEQMYTDSDVRKDIAEHGVVAISISLIRR